MIQEPDPFDRGREHRVVATTTGAARGIPLLRHRRGGRRGTPPSRPTAVGLRLGEKGRRLPENRVGAAALPILSLERLDPLPVRGGQPGPLPVVSLRPAHPPPHRFGDAAEVRGDGRDGGPLRPVRGGLLPHQLNGSLLDLRETWLRYGMAPISHRIEPPGKPGRFKIVSPPEPR